MSSEYRKAVEDVESRTNDRKEPTLEKTEGALEALGRPDRDYRIVLVGGTNGKGSTSEMISKMLQSQGFSTGKFTSPHMETVRERIEIDGEKISREEFLELYRELSGFDLTFFEFMTVAAYRKFSQEDVDYAVVEVGMGGRLDATNAAENSIAAITNIGMDHSEYLGDNREEIASEKAGIIPENGKLIDHSKNQEIRRIGRERNAELVPVEKVDRESGKYIYRDEEFEIPLKGGFQKQNLETALTAMKALDQIPERIGNSLEDVELFGRMSRVMEDPETFFDGAHNPEALRETVDEYSDRFICVFNVIKSKEISEMIDIVEKKSGKIYLTGSSFKLSEDPERIAEEVSIEHEVVKDPETALEKAQKHAGETEIVVTGSLYLLGDLKQRLDI